MGRSLSHGERQERGRNGFVQKSHASVIVYITVTAGRGMGSLGKFAAVDDLPADKTITAQSQPSTQDV